MIATISVTWRSLTRRPLENENATGTCPVACGERMEQGRGGQGKELCINDAANVCCVLL